MSVDLIQDQRTLARTISAVENEAEGYRDILAGLQINYNTPVIGLTGPPGAGKSTLLNELITSLAAASKKVAILAVDPSSPFNFGALLGDRVRMGSHYDNPNIYIRSLASRGSLGGLSEKIIELVDVVRAAGFDYIFVETVGVGQAEVEIAGIADTTVVVLVPDAGDEVQTMKAGLMEVADIFVVNKSDRVNADTFAENLEHLVHAKDKGGWTIPVLKTIASEGQGTEGVIKAIDAHGDEQKDMERRAALLAQKAIKLIAKERTSDIDESKIREAILKELGEGFNLYTFIEKLV